MQAENEENDSNAFDELGLLGEEIEFIPESEILVTEKQRKRKKSANKQQPEKQRIQYATRGKQYSYCEAEVPEDDHYICKLKIQFLIFLLLTPLQS